MSERGERLADHLRRSVSGPMWHGPALWEVLEHVPAGIASARPIAGAHSIWELVLHIAVWAEIADERVHGRSLATPPPSEDFPAVADFSTECWNAAVARLRASYMQLAETTAGLSDEELAASVPTSGPPHTVLDLLHGVIEHGTYHGGQIALLDRAARSAGL